MLWVVLEGLVQLHEREPLRWLQRPTAEHEFVDTVGAAGWLLQTEALVLNHVQDLRERGST